MGADMSVFVVRVEGTGLWDAACCNEACGWFHGVSEDNETQEAAEKAAAAHRTEIRREAAEETATVKQAERGTAVHWADIARQREREIARLERDLEAARVTLARVHALAEEWGEPHHCGWLSASVLVRQLSAALAPADGEQTGDDRE